MPQILPTQLRLHLPNAQSATETKLNAAVVEKTQKNDDATQKLAKAKAAHSVAASAHTAVVSTGNQFLSDARAKNKSEDDAASLARTTAVDGNGGGEQSVRGCIQ